MDMKELEAKIQKCCNCILCKTRTHTVTGRGNEKADVMFVGEAPGEHEDEFGKPFVGDAGRLLSLYLKAVGIDEKQVYICNILKCRPPQNRDPLPEEEDACIGFLREQVKLVRPKIIVCLGRVAAKRLISPDFQVTKDHGKWYEKGSFRLMGVYHPSALLRDSTKREDMLKDLSALAEQIADMK